MPRPRSSTFYLPLAPIDAPLELKAKLSVLPPSAANALLTPRTSRPLSATSSSSCSTSSPPSTTTFTPRTQEDECTRLNRVLGIPTSAAVVGASLAPPTTIGRRRHTDAPKPSFPLVRSRSPLRASPSNPSNTSDWAFPPLSLTHPQPLDTDTDMFPALPVVLMPVSVTDDPNDETSAMAWTKVDADTAEPEQTVNVDLSSDDMHAFAVACQDQPEQAEPKPPVSLSGIPCGLRTILACRTKNPSRFASSRPLPSSTLPTDSLHPQDTRHLLKREHRLAFPPPPAPPLAILKEEDEVEQSIECERPCTPRQRFRLAPLYLPKVLRRSLGPTTWARAEAVRAARMLERGEQFGWPYCPGAPTTDWNNGAAGIGSWWDRLPHGASSDTSSSGAASLVWSGYEDVYEDHGMDLSCSTMGESMWDWEDDVEPVPIQSDEETFVRESAPEPEERPEEVEDTAGYAMVGKFGWDTTWPKSPISPLESRMPPVTRRVVRREDGEEEEEEEEEIFRYSPQDADDMDVESPPPQSLPLPASNCSTPTATSPSFPPSQLRGITISSSFEESYQDEEFYDADGDAEMEVPVPVSRPQPLAIRAPRPLSLVQHPVLHHEYSEEASSPTSGVFIIPPSPLTNTTFESGTGTSTPTSAKAPIPTFADRMEEEGDLSNVSVAWGDAHSLSGKRSYERIVAPRPQRPLRVLEHDLGVSSPPPSRVATLAASPPPSSTSPRLPSSPRWTFGSLKSALSNSMSHLVELARSRSPSPLPWIMRGANSSNAGVTLAGAAAALDAQHQRQGGSLEELEAERATGCVTPTPAVSHSRRSSTTTITGPTTSRLADSHLPVLKLQVDDSSMMMSESPPPKRTLSTSSLSSLGSEPDSESGSSGGIFSRSPSPEPGSERIWDPAYTLTPRSRPISADAKASVACGGRLSPMVIPGSWDPEELWAEEGDLAQTW